MSRRRRRFRDALIGLILLAFLIRLVGLFRTYLVFEDTAHYVDMARMLLEGNFTDVVRHPYHPLFAGAIAATSLVLPDRIQAATVFSLVIGSVAVVPLVLLWRRIAGSTVALLAGLAFAVSPYPVRFAAAGHSESLYFFCFFFAAYFGCRALTDGTVRAPLFCAVMSGLAYLVRPEGAGVFLLVFLALAVQLPIRLRSRGFRAARPLVACAVMFIVLGTPYLVIKYRSTGVFQLTGKKSISTMLGLGAGQAPGYDGGPVEMLQRVGGDFASSLSYVFLPLAVMGGLFYFSRRRRVGSEITILLLVILYCALFLLLLRSYGYLSRRHVTPVSCLVLGWSGMGMWMMVRMARSLLEKVAARNRAFGRIGVPLVLSGLLLGGTLPKAWKPMWQSQTPVRSAGGWLAARAREEGPIRVCTPYQWSDPRIPVYGELPIEQPTILDLAEMQRYLEAEAPGYLAVLRHRAERIVSDSTILRSVPGLELVFEEDFLEESNRGVEIYRYTRP